MVTTILFLCQKLPFRIIVIEDHFTGNPKFILRQPLEQVWCVPYIDFYRILEEGKINKSYNFVKSKTDYITTKLAKNCKTFKPIYAISLWSVPKFSSKVPFRVYF